MAVYDAYKYMEITDFFDKQIKEFDEEFYKNTKLSKNDIINDTGFDIYFINFGYTIQKIMYHKIVYIIETSQLNY